MITKLLTPQVWLHARNPLASHDSHKSPPGRKILDAQSEPGTMDGLFGRVYQRSMCHKNPCFTHLHVKRTRHGFLLIPQTKRAVCCWFARNKVNPATYCSAGDTGNRTSEPKTNDVSTAARRWLPTSLGCNSDATIPLVCARVLLQTRCDSLSSLSLSPLRPPITTAFTMPRKR